MLRYVMLVVAFLAVATVANATCLTCVPTNFLGDGMCQETTSGWCSYTCCLSDLGNYCPMNERSYFCSDPGGFAEIPPIYFATKLPLYTQGSALRLRWGKGIAVQQKCAAVSLLQGRS